MTDRSAPAGVPTISFSREFEADAARLFAAHLDPDQVCRWIGPRGTSCAIRAFDGRTGGHWSWVVSAPDGRSWGFHGCFHEVSAPDRLVWTFSSDDDPMPSLELLTFTDLGGGRSRLEGVSTYLTVSDRDAVMKDLEPARDEDFARLDEHLARG